VQWVSAAPWILREAHLAHRVLNCVCAGLRKQDENVQNTSLVILKYALPLHAVLHHPSLLSPPPLISSPSFCIGVYRFLMYDSGLYPAAPTPSIALGSATGQPTFPSASASFPAAVAVAPSAPLPPLVPSLARTPLAPSALSASTMAVALRLAPVLAYSSPLTESAVLHYLIVRFTSHSIRFYSSQAASRSLR
jgi:hypothetical protein